MTTLKACLREQLPAATLRAPKLAPRRAPRRGPARQPPLQARMLPARVQSALARGAPHLLSSPRHRMARKPRRCRCQRPKYRGHHQRSLPLRQWPRRWPVPRPPASVRLARASLPPMTAARMAGAEVAARGRWRQGNRPNNVLRWTASHEAKGQQTLASESSRAAGVVRTKAGSSARLWTGISGSAFGSRRFSTETGTSNG